MTATALVILGVAMLAGSIVALSWREERLVSGLALWLAGLAMTHVWLGHLWQLRAQGWEAAYQRDIRTIGMPCLAQTQSPQKSQSRLPRIYFAGQFPFGSNPFAQQQPVSWGLQTREKDWNPDSQKTRNSNTGPSASSIEPSPASCFSTSLGIHRLASRVGFSHFRSNGLTIGDLGTAAQSDPTPIAWCCLRFGTNFIK